jgi:hypothetical protein
MLDTAANLTVEIERMDRDLAADKGSAQLEAMSDGWAKDAPKSDAQRLEEVPF